MPKTLCQFGQVLFDELDQIAVRRGGFSSLAWLKSGDSGRQAIEELGEPPGPYLVRVGLAIGSVRDLVTLAQSRLDTAVNILRVTIRAAKAGEPLSHSRLQGAWDILDGSEAGPPTPTLRGRFTRHFRWLPKGRERWPVTLDRLRPLWNGYTAARDAALKKLSPDVPASTRAAAIKLVIDEARTTLGDPKTRVDSGELGDFPAALRANLGEWRSIRDAHERLAELAEQGKFVVKLKEATDKVNQAEKSLPNSAATEDGSSWLKNVDLAIDLALEAVARAIEVRDAAVGAIRRVRTRIDPTGATEPVEGAFRFFQLSTWWKRRVVRIPQIPAVLYEIDDIEADGARHAAMTLNTMGLAFSGGGIRSATFNLGLLQGLAAQGLFPIIDYLSTVSGGGYIGAWLASWIRREGGQAADPAPNPANPAESERERNRKRERGELALENVQKQLQISRIEQARASRRWVTRAEIMAGAEAPAQAPTTPPPAGSLPPEPIWPLNRVVESEPQPVYHLRAYSNYLAPKLGLASADTWTMVSVYLRNLLLNQFILLPTVLALLLIPRALLWLFSLDLATHPTWHARAEWGVTCLMVGTAVLGIHMIYRVVAKIRSGRVRPRPGEDHSGREYEVPLSFVTRCILAPMTVSAFCLSVLFSHRGGSGLGMSWYLPANLLLGGWDGTPRDWHWYESIGPSAFLFGGLMGIVRGLASLGVELASQWKASKSRPEGVKGKWLHFRRLFKLWTAAFRSGLISVAGLYLILALIRRNVLTHDLLAPLMMTFGPPLVLLFIGVGSAIEVGLIGGHEEEDMREWRASLMAYFLMIAVVWIIFVGISLFGPLLIWATSKTLATAIAAGWLTTSILGVLSGRSAKTGESKQGGPLNWIATVAPLVFVIGLVAAVAMLASIAQGVPIPIDSRVEGVPLAYFHQLSEANVWATLAVLILCVDLAYYNCTKINVNLFSMHLFYANRLVRCYLGASRPRRPPIEGRPNFAPTNCPVPARRPNPLTGFDPDDDFNLKDLAIVRRWDRENDLVCDYRGPYPLVNTAMNLVAGSDLAWQERMAESFLLSPLYCGSKSTGYRKGVVTQADVADLPSAERRDDDETPEDGLVKGYAGDIRLGTAISVSGAAASPNMGYHSSPLVTILLTVFNARLGLWLPNPARDTWREAGPGFASYLIDELTGRTTDKGKYVYLSDGGHFENLGVYELVRRRCRFIVVSDAGADPGSSFWDLGGLVRKCREDFGVSIDIDIAPLLKEPETGKSRRHYAVGTIKYKEADGKGAEDGVLLYLKPAITGDEPADLRNYVVDHRDFPHQSTADQFFSESQFESYRALGEHTAKQVFERIKAPAGRSFDIATFAGSFKPPLTPLPPGFDKRFVSTIESLIEANAALVKDEDLTALSIALFHEAVPTHGSAFKAHAEFHAVSRMLQVMQKTWLEVDLDGYADHHMNQGWMRQFRRWANCSVFKKYWPILRDDLSEGFIQFYKEQLLEKNQAHDANHTANP